MKPLCVRPPYAHFLLYIYVCGSHLAVAFFVPNREFSCLCTMDSAMTLQRVSEMHCRWPLIAYWQSTSHHNADLSALNLHLRGGGNRAKKATGAISKTHSASRSSEHSMSDSYSGSPESMKGKDKKDKLSELMHEKGIKLTSDMDDDEWTDVCERGRSSSGSLDIGGQSFTNIDSESDNVRIEPVSSSSSTREKKGPSHSKDTQRCVPPTMRLPLHHSAT
jgi:hypothetical protein